MNRYFEKHAFCEQQIAEKPLPDLGLSVVVPCHNETNLLKTFESLAACTLPKCKTEIITVINAAENASEEIKQQNLFTEIETERWILRNESPSLRYFAIVKNDLPEKDAGVGLARKIGMDEAARRFIETGNKNGIIACLDADCTVESNYLTALENHFLLNPAASGCSVYFEHPLDGNEFSSQVYEGIQHYELFLRYYNCGLRFSGFPFAFHTIGSSMAVRANIYMQQGGMNKRKAGEDFYFLSKIFPLGGFTELNETTVFTSPRPSLRVPFGTGKAITQWLENANEKNLTYHPKTFTDLGDFFAIVQHLFDMPYEEYKSKLNSLSPALSTFLSENDFENKLNEINENVSSREQFVNRFYRWFNNFMVLKFTHFARDNFYEKTPLEKNAKELLNLAGIDTGNISGARELLLIYRELERNNKAALLFSNTALV